MWPGGALQPPSGLGNVVAVAAGVLVAVCLHLSRTLRRTTYPLLVASQTIPIVIVAPLLVVWLGYDLAPKLAIIGLICFFPVTVTTLDGLAGVDPELRKLMRTLDASRSSRWSTRRGGSAGSSRSS